MYNQYQQQQQYQQPPQQGYAPQGAPQYQGQPQQQQYAPGPGPQQGYGQPAPAAQNTGTSLMVQGRLVWIGGSLFAGKLKVDDKKQPVIDQKTGQQVVEYGFGLAVPKNTPLHKQVMDALYKEAYTIYPNGQFPNDFAFKFKDGDGIDHNGQPFANREGYAGHIILNCTTQIPLKCFIWQQGNNVMVNDGIKCGDYVNVQLNIVAHPPKGRGKAGLYLNPSAIQLIQPGKEIINAPSGDQMFGQNAPQYTLGPIVADQAPQMPGQGYAPQGAPQYQGQAPGPQQGYQGAPMPGQQQYAPQQGYQQQAPQADPHYGVLPQHHQPQQGNGQYAPQGTPGPGQAYPGNQTQGYPPAGNGQTAPNGAFPSNMPMPQR